MHLLIYLSIRQDQAFVDRLYVASIYEKSTE